MTLMSLQVVIDIDVDMDFGLTKALKICRECGSERLFSDSMKRIIHIVISEDVEDKISCLSSIKGFFTVDLRLFVKLCRLDPAILKALGVTIVPKAMSKRIIGYIHIDNRVCILEKTSRENTVMVRVIKGRTIPTILEPSLYLIHGTNNEIINRVIDTLRILEIFRNMVLSTINDICMRGS